jgi:hypothetical protein
MSDKFDLIFRYTRADALRDGVLIDVTPTAKEAGIKYPVAVTRAVYDQHIRVPPGSVSQDEAGRLWDIAFMLRFAITRHPDAEGDTLLYTVFVRNTDDDAPQPVKLKAIAHPDDEGGPCITVMLPHEN